MIMISNKDNCKTPCYRVYSIDRKNKEGFKKINQLTPSRKFSKKWDDLHKKNMTYEKLKEYVTDYYNDVLKDLNPKNVYLEMPNNAVIISGNNQDIFSHNMIVAYWLELFLEVDIPLVKIDGYKLSIQDKRPIIEEILEKVIKKNTDTLGYNCLKAYQLHKDSETLRRRALDAKYAGLSCENYINLSNELLKQAAIEEELYNTKGRSRKLVK